LISVTSFHASKTVSAGEGGALLTDDAGLYKRGLNAVNHGMSTRYVHERAGRNLRIGGVAAAFARAQLSRIAVLHAGRKRVEERYIEAMADWPVVFQTETKDSRRGTWVVGARVAYRDSLVAELRSHSIDARAAWPSLTAQPFLKPVRESAPVARTLASEVVMLPTFAHMAEEEIGRVIDSTGSYLARCNGGWIQ
jgi:perosamine synthetase